jgi:hypothetical protein
MMFPSVPSRSSEAKALMHPALLRRTAPRERRPHAVRRQACSAEKATKLLAYRTQVSLREGLISMIDWIRAHGTMPFEYHLPIEIDSPLLPSTWRDRLL